MIVPLSVPSLCALGYADRDARGRVDLLDRVRRGHAELTGRPAQWCWFVPGRIEVFGKHTDYAGGRSLLAAVPRGFAFAASARDDAVVRASDVAAGESRLLRVADAETVVPGWLNYVRTVVRRLALNFPGADLGADVSFASDLPRASGMSSSSALLVGSAAALIRRGAIDKRPEWRASIATELDFAGYLGAMERGAAYGPFEGTAAVGTFGGSEDHTAILTCRAGTLSAYRYVPVRPAGEAAMPSDWRFVVAASGVAADKAGGARDLYNAASLTADAIVRLWNRETGESRATIADILDSSRDAVRRLRALVGSNRIDAFDSDALSRRLQHFIAEDARVPAAVAAFRDADETALGDLAATSQRDAETLLRNQTSETSALAALAREQGAVAASSFGAGFGGSVWALCRADRADAFGARWLEAYRSRFPDRKQASWFVAQPAPGMIEVR